MRLILALLKAIFIVRDMSPELYFSASFPLQANFASDRYFLFGVHAGRPSSLTQIVKVSERPCIVLHEVICLNVIARALSP